MSVRDEREGEEQRWARNAFRQQFWPDTWEWIKVSGEDWMGRIYDHSAILRKPRAGQWTVPKPVLLIGRVPHQAGRIQMEKPHSVQWLIMSNASEMWFWYEGHGGSWGAATGGCQPTVLPRVLLKRDLNRRPLHSVHSVLLDIPLHPNTTSALMSFFIALIF